MNDISTKSNIGLAARHSPCRLLFIKLSTSTAGAPATTHGRCTSPTQSTRHDERTERDCCRADGHGGAPRREFAPLHPADVPGIDRHLLACPVTRATTN